MRWPPWVGPDLGEGRNSTSRRAHVIHWARLFGVFWHHGKLRAHGGSFEKKKNPTSIVAGRSPCRAGATSLNADRAPKSLLSLAKAVLTTPAKTTSSVLPLQHRVSVQATPWSLALNVSPADLPWSITLRIVPHWATPLSARSETPNDEVRGNSRNTPLSSRLSPGREKTALPAMSRSNPLKCGKL